MTLKERLANLERIRSIVPCEVDRAEIRRFLEDAKESLRDSHVKGLSAGSSGKLAYEANHTLCLAALRAHGYRPAGGQGHRAVAFEVVDVTAGLSPEDQRTLRAMHHRRNAMLYEGEGEFSATDIETLQAIARKLVTAVSKMTV